MTHSLCLIKSTACFALAFSILLNSQRFRESKHNDIDPYSHFTNHKKRDSQRNWTPIGSAVISRPDKEFCTCGDAMLMHSIMPRAKYLKLHKAI